MKKILMSVIILLLLSLVVVGMLKGINAGPVNIPSIEQLKTASEELDDSISKATTITSITYPNKVGELDSASKEMITEKSTYEDMIMYSSEEQVRNAKQFETYEIEFLWVKLGEYIRKESLQGRFDLTRSSNGIPNANDIKFTISGTYRDIIEFLYDIENDAKFNFKIEDFNISGSGKTIQADFIVKDLSVTGLEGLTASSAPATSDVVPDPDEDVYMDEE